MEATKGLFKKIQNWFTGESDSLDEPEKQKPLARKHKSAKLENIPKISDVFTLLLLCDDKDGYKREAAIKQLDKIGSAESIPNLIKLNNDWVPQVRVAAKEALLNLAIPEHAETFVMTLPELYHLKKCKRVDHQELIQVIETFLTCEENASHVIDGMNSPDHKISRACFVLVINNKLMHPQDFIKKGLRHPELKLRLKTSHFLKDLEGEAKKEALNIAITDRTVQIRREAFLIMLQTWGNDPLAKELLFDPHPAIREIAIAHLRKAKEDVQYTYLRSLSDDDPKILCTALWGLGHLNGVECARQIQPFEKHEHPAVRKQATKTLESFNDGPKKFTDTVEWNSIDTFY